MKKVYIERNKLFKNITMIMLNNINQIDESFVEDNYSLFESECDECKGSGYKDDNEDIKCEDCGGEGRHDSEVYQSFLAEVDEYDIERLKSYGVELGYSNKLEKYILPIYDFGTSWSVFSYSKEVDDDYELASYETLERTTVY